MKYDGSAILIKTQIKHQLIDDFITDVTEIKVETPIGPISIATTHYPLGDPT